MTDQIKCESCQTISKQAECGTHSDRTYDDGYGSRICTVEEFDTCPECHSTECFPVVTCETCNDYEPMEGMDECAMCVVADMQANIGNYEQDVYAQGLEELGRINDRSNTPSTVRAGVAA